MDVTAVLVKISHPRREVMVVHVPVEVRVSTGWPAEVSPFRPGPVQHCEREETRRTLERVVALPTRKRGGERARVRSGGIRSRAVWMGMGHNPFEHARPREPCLVRRALVDDFGAERFIAADVGCFPRLPKVGQHSPLSFSHGIGVGGGGGTGARDGQPNTSSFSHLPHPSAVYDCLVPIPVH